MAKSEEERRRDEESRRKLEAHLARMNKLGRVPTESDDAEEQRHFQSDWERWKKQFAGRVFEFREMAHRPADPNADHKLLGVSTKATQAEIRRAFYKLAKTNHPDHGGDAERFHDLMMAYQRLSGGK
jgi:hypothetical protein